MALMPSIHKQHHQISPLATANAIFLLIIFHSPTSLAETTAESTSTTSAKVDVYLFVVLFFFMYLMTYFSLNLFFAAQSGSPTELLHVSTKGENGVDNSVIQMLPTCTYSEVMRLRHGDDKLECAICLSLFKDEDGELRMLPTCGHVFHPECVDDWLGAQATCPCCRAILVALTHK